MDELINNFELRLWWQSAEWVNGNGILAIEKSIRHAQMQDSEKQENSWEAEVRGCVRTQMRTLVLMLSFCFSLINDTLHSHSRCRLSYRRPSTLTAMSWLFPTTCLYITIPSMGEGLADSTLQKVRLLIWRMVGTFFCILWFAALLFPHHSFFQSPPHHPTVTHLVAPNS